MIFNNESFSHCIISTISILEYLNSLQSDINWLEAIDHNKIRVFKNIISTKYILNKGDILNFNLNEYKEPEANLHIEIIYEDDSLLVINKPAPLPVHPSGSWNNHTVTKILENKMGYKELYSIHRLDSETSGVLLFSKNKFITSSFQKLLSQGTKHYLTCVENDFKFFLKVECKLDSKIGSTITKKKGINEKGKYSLTYFKPLKKLRHSTLVLAHPITGRTHQIRAHLSEMGYAIVGDKIYGVDETLFIEFLEKGFTDNLKSKLKLHRQFLHCYKIVIYHPFLKKKMVFKADLPSELIKFIADEGTL